MQPNAVAHLAVDTQPLAQLRLQAKQSPEQALKAAAQQFESIFLGMMLKSMRAATAQEGMFDSEQTKLFTGMLDQQLAQNMASRGIGLADIMVRQLSRGMPASPAISPQAATQPTTVTGAVPSAYAMQAQQGFVDRMLPSAMRASQATGVPPQLMLGQAALESGWGKREILAADGGNSFNVFGIKADAGWQGKVVETTTTEFRNGVAHKEVARFRAYASYDEAFQDYARLIGRNPRYAEVMRQQDSNAGMAQAVQQAGYATDPKYGEKLVRVMDMITAKG
jgi:flagellar protein FlgJ